MSFKALQGHQRNKELLQRALQSGRLPHAFIFAGPAGVGKHQFALTLAKAVNCERLRDDSCDECGSCRRIAQDGSLDVKVVEPEKDKTVISIKAIRELAAQAYARPMEARRRVFVIDPADRMNEQAMNSLLKTLEEPAETSLIILVTARAEALLPTIRSRCQLLRFTPLSVDQVSEYLGAHFRRPAEDTRMLARISQGRLGQALAIDLSVYKERRAEVVELMDLLTGTGHRAHLVKKAEQLGKREREEFESSLDLWCSLLRDVVTIIAQAPATHLMHEDLQPRLNQYAARLDLATITQWFERIEELRRNLRVNISRQLATEALLLHFAAGRAGKSPAEL